MMTDSIDPTQAVAAIFHANRAAAKKRRRDQPKGSAPLPHRANTDWWTHVPGGKKNR